MKFSKNILFIAGAIVIIIALQFFIPRHVAAPHQVRATIASTTLELLIAKTPEERNLGLGGRESLKESEAMLFVFDSEAKHSFWMKGMKFPIDIIWLDESFRVVHFEQKVATSTYPKTSFSPRENALYVLETNAGFSEKNNLKIGDVFDINLNR